MTPPDGAPPRVEGFLADPPDTGGGLIADPATVDLPDPSPQGRPVEEAHWSDTIFTYKPIKPVDIGAVDDLPPKTREGYDNAVDPTVRDAVFEKALKGRTIDGEDDKGRTHVWASGGGAEGAKQTLRDIVAAAGGKVERVKAIKGVDGEFYKFPDGSSVAWRLESSGKGGQGESTPTVEIKLERAMGSHTLSRCVAQSKELPHGLPADRHRGVQS
ncbi:hypothetical protein [Roseospirillum parvum]|uniref:Uncharacterized protein n=1 Tax=Roseospirillum parvum TaxID=83401 RepID=A0A1G7V7E4_9PROT|nr:hypothetical protein [Roseospirillum parvum]SDG55289.1 hypothetical protein SAMN05421742_101555 [Roseospirillum parvum]